MMKILSVLFALFPVLSNAHVGAGIEHFALGHHLAIWAIVAVAIVGALYFAKKMK